VRPRWRQIGVVGGGVLGLLGAARLLEPRAPEGVPVERDGALRIEQVDVRTSTDPLAVGARVPLATADVGTLAAIPGIGTLGALQIATMRGIGTPIVPDEATPWLDTRIDR
jgi:hypothetical protein